ncbi:MAG: hypothetical protein JWO03_3425 [Bacteroidetes bacterium]|nr:hypothetical protein [Bacteroidota bacterium]
MIHPPTPEVQISAQDQITLLEDNLNHPAKEQSLAEIVLREQQRHLLAYLYEIESEKDTAYDTTLDK